uniref:Uncharacterized protein n=1 Tax=virus sp. ctML55 TaxID=2827627 RepID=A0A8S5RH89_9VIRU|nr:MAG TPA: hypothetical protein [virus sp. ctML55]
MPCFSYFKDVLINSLNISLRELISSLKALFSCSCLCFSIISGFNCYRISSHPLIIL